MRIIKKLLSKRGQVSMEIGILVAAAVAVAAIAAYFYASNVKVAAENAGKGANGTINTLTSAANKTAAKIENLT
ncbi:class III signal peptide-containing protein [Methanocaldococcus indicus]|uniref:class III signal peptide-containing protein n=1 Tax=Methanocaldococcus indicus TaxID=213231 RepID=UPI003C6D226F